MNNKFIAAACLALCSSASFAATVLPCDTTSPVNLVNTCATDAKATDFASLFIAGSSALGGALGVVVAADLFDTTTQPVITLNYTGTDNAGQVSGWYGMSKAALTGGVSKRLFVVYNKNNGSAAGVSQMLAKFDGKTTIIPESKVLTVGPVAGVAGTCTVAASSTAAKPVLDCASSALRLADMAISDVAPAELYKLYTAATGKLTTLISTPLAIQGFGVAVSANLYSALQAAQGGVAQPSISRASYASLVTGKVKSASALIPGDSTALTLARRDDLSGTQASSNIYFANNSCGINHDAKGKLIKGVLGGALPVISSADSVAGLNVLALAVGGDVVTELNKPGYGIGVISLTSAPKASDSWKFIKLDGISPNTDAKQRASVASGDYGFAMTAFAVTYVKPKVSKLELTKAVTLGLQDSNLHDLTGIAYLDKQVAAKQSLVARVDSNNCSPFVKGL